MSPRALVSAVDEIASVMNMADIIYESKVGFDESFCDAKDKETQD